MPGNRSDRATARSDFTGPASHEHTERRPTALTGLLKLADGEEATALVVDLSPNGCRIETPVTLEAGELVRLIVADTAIDAEVRWFSDGSAGLSFNIAPEFVADETQPREGTRVRATIKATMQRHGKPRFGISVVDLSVNGCKVEFVDRPDVGERVHMRFDGLASIEGNVRWVAGIEAGIHFEAPIHAAVFDLLLLRSTPSTAHRQ